ncbi:class GN sortase [Erythrobacter sp. Dej080120_24]|uniref:sortase domain-containing protein n=1 Tax=unclassified Erythrobacter TaxID=2633097 RepID=UPI00291E77EF|nr:class GN sortase [Erythrobacter sp. Dej080120_24]
MQAVLTIVQDKGRAASKGGIGRALPLLLCAILLLSGAALTARALYIPIKAEVAQVLLNRAFDQSLAARAPVKPWSWADTAPMARITVPRLGASDVVLSGGSGEAMAFGPTAIVDDPARRVTILAAHRDTHFLFVRDLKAGDEILMERIDGTRARYRVTGFETLRWDEFSYPADGGEGVLALTTCFPFDTHTPGPLRRVAWAERMS